MQKRVAPEQQVIEWQAEQRQHVGGSPVVASHGGCHGYVSFVHCLGTLKGSLYAEHNNDGTEAVNH